MPLILVRVVFRLSDVRDCLQDLVVSTLVELAVNTLGNSARSYLSVICVSTRGTIQYIHVIELESGIEKG